MITSNPEAVVTYYQHLQIGNTVAQISFLKEGAKFLVVSLQGDILIFRSFSFHDNNMSVIITITIIFKHMILRKY